MSFNNEQLRRPSRVMYLDDLKDDNDEVSNENPQRRKSLIMDVNELGEVPRRKSFAGKNSQTLDENRIAEIEKKIQKKMSLDGNVNKKIKVVHHLEDEDDSASTITEVSSYGISSASKLHKKLLSGFHPYHDEETDMMALQCSTCCIGCWRNCSERCTGCENFLSCPIYCWCGVLVPFFIILFAGFILTIFYATGKIG